ncbi:MAG TPA: DNA repair protein RadA [Mycobacteriales bacterium]|jgi:DNA repair protein RadA/Sms|nr:DNA repair protein RadA [Mycobacteriales bacterium]
MAKPPSKDRPSHRCSECGLSVGKWVGRCPECQAWGSISEVALLSAAALRTAPGAVTAPARRIADVDVEAARARPTGVGELDRVLGGGLVPGAVVLLAGEPGVGKSTLILEVAARAARAGSPTLYVTGEESAAQVRLRAGRTGALDPHLWLAAETDLAAVLSHIDEVRPGLLVVDSVQTIASAQLEGGAGGVTQIRAVTAALIAVAKERGIATVLVGHVTKDGSIAGPRLLEHLVDVVLQFEGERHSTLRLVRAVKNRFGPADEVGCFTLGDGGIQGLPDPSGLFLTRRTDPVPGTCVTVTVEGRRPMPAEVQALVDKSQLSNPRRAVSGLDSGRVGMVLAVLSSRCGLKYGDCDIYTATVGGVRLTEPAADLAVALAVSSALTGLPLPPDLVAIGEVGLSGEVRPVTGVSRRLLEASRLGFTRALVPVDAGTAVPPPGMRVTEVADVQMALAAVRALPRLPRVIG